MNIINRGNLLLFMSTLMIFGTDANAVKRNALTEQERMKSYQLRLQNFIRSKVQQGEMSERREPLQCYSCRNARTNEECNRGGLVTCSPTQTACHTEIKVFNPKQKINVRIKKGCKQERNCQNYFLKDKNAPWLSMHCNQIPRSVQSVCRQCCKESGCNQALQDRVCSQVQVPEFGSVTCKQENMRSSVCTFECEPCYRLTGSTVRMCLENDLWSGTKTKCTFDDSLPDCRSLTSCPAEVVRPPSQGNVECSDANNIGSECRFICQKGFYLTGKRVLRCRNSDLKWDADRPECIRGDDTRNPCNVFASFEYTADGHLTCDCNTGFTGDGFISCDDVDECAKDDDFCHENADCINIIGSYRCQCREGYRGNGFECGDINECSSESTNDCDSENGICVNRDGGYSCACKPGFIGDGRACRRGKAECPGVLEGDVCLVNPSLGALSDVQRIGHVDATPPELGDNPIQSFVSLSKSSSDDEMHSCVKIIEDKPSMIRDPDEYRRLNDRLLQKITAASNNTEIVFGPSVGLDDRVEPGVLRWRDGRRLDESDFQMWAPGQPKLIDNKGFGNCVDMVSNPVQSKTLSFLWQITLCSQPTRFVCESEELFGDPILSCLPLLDFAYGKISCTDDWLAGSVCSFSCDRGFILRGPSSRLTCDGVTGRWSNEVPICTRTICSQPLMPPNSGIMECTNENKEGSVCSFSCRPGFELHGNDTVTCDRNLRWTSQRPCCRDDCPPLARMNLILVLDSSRSINATNFQLIKQFAKSLHRRFEISEDFAQVSVITYHRTVNLLNGVKVYKSSDELDIALDGLPYEGAGTYTGKAINYVTDNLIGLRPGAGDIVVVLTDGISHDDVYHPSKILREAGAHIIAVGVRHAWRYQLNLIASEPTDVNVVQVESFPDLSQIVNVIGQKVCHLSC